MSDLRQTLEKWVEQGGSDWSRPEAEQLLELLWPVIQAAELALSKASSHHGVCSIRHEEGIALDKALTALREKVGE